MDFWSFALPILVLSVIVQQFLGWVKTLVEDGLTGVKDRWPLLVGTLLMGLFLGLFSIDFFAFVNAVAGTELILPPGFAWVGYVCGALFGGGGQQGVYELITLLQNLRRENG